MVQKTVEYYRQKHSDAVANLASVDINIRNRCLEMCKANPDVPVDWEFLYLNKPHELTPQPYSRKSGRFGELVEAGSLTPDTKRLLDVMTHIEDWNGKWEMKVDLNNTIEPIIIK